MLINKNRPSKIKIFGERNFLCSMISKMDVKMNLMIMTKNHAADSRIRSPQKILDFRADGKPSPPDSLEDN